MEIRSFRDLTVWQSGKELALQVYKITSSFPREEIYGVTSQMRRAAVSVPANIAEGFNRRHNREFKRFLSIALGSIAELETLVELVFEFNYVDEDQSDKLFELLDHEGRMLRALITRLTVN
ncbi:MAG: four helix bundle protein [Gammaproteobacteria bacterium]